MRSADLFGFPRLTAHLLRLPGGGTGIYDQVSLKFASAGSRAWIGLIEGFQNAGTKPYFWVTGGKYHAQGMPVELIPNGSFPDSNSTDGRYPAVSYPTVVGFNASTNPINPDVIGTAAYRVVASPGTGVTDAQPANNTLDRTLTCNPKLPDLQVAAIEFTPDCRTRVRLVNGGDAPPEDVLFMTGYGARLARSLDDRPADWLWLGNIDPNKQLKAPGGALETFVKARQQGLTRYLGFSAHSESAALALMEAFAFDTILFPINWTCWFQGDFAPRVLPVARAEGMGVLAL